ncbi:two-component sensor histidine kinase [Actinoplanes ianthinogenes]|uniref:histidine kinase n=2 Tax=Actinoplanes ianthinogenes TaxID=122358 RepID=A0ABM7LMU9_9ACTN|nr:histidine kinase [Actinoplanes ianthinogenes]BCJ40549.1 two-component sensor histidine kinase [Actinoplanes ianthinogenes]GGR50177.1 two-component sensor histidine kinase [Actinoplanes ianthinogenes]
MAAAGERVFDLAAIAVSWFGALVIAGEAEASGRTSDGVTFFGLLLALAASTALWWRRSHPVAVAALFVPISAVTDFVGVAGSIAFYTLVTLRRGRVIGFVLVGTLLAALVYSRLRPDPELSTAAEFAITLAFSVATVALGLAMRARRDLVEVLRERAARAEDEARVRAERLRALERERIAREMHDALAHRISMVSLHAGALQIRPDLAPEDVAKAATTIRDSAHQALEDLREILGVLRAGEPGDGVRPQPDLKHLDELVAEARAAGVTIDFVDGLPGAPVGAGLGRTVYRLVQEGLTNAGKHAPGTTAHVELTGTPGGELHVLIGNPLAAGSRHASAPESPPGAGAGLVGLAERVDLVGGRFRHGVHRDSAGVLTFRLEAWLPWPV